MLTRKFAQPPGHLPAEPTGRFNVEFISRAATGLQKDSVFYVTMDEQQLRAYLAQTVSATK